MILLLSNLHLHFSQLCINVTWYLPIFFPQTNINTLKFYIVCLTCFCPELPVLTVLKINGKVTLSIYLWFTLWIIKTCAPVSRFFCFCFCFCFLDREWIKQNQGIFSHWWRTFPLSLEHVYLNLPLKMAFSPEGVEVKQSRSSEKEPELLLPGKLIRIDKKTSWWQIWDSIFSMQQSTQGSATGQTKLSCNQPLLNQGQDLLKWLITFACETWCYLPFKTPYCL